MTYDNQWGELILSDQYTPETYAQYVQKNFEDSQAAVAEVHRHVRRRLGQAVLQLIGRIAAS